MSLSTSMHIRFPKLTVMLFILFLTDTSKTGYFPCFTFAFGLFPPPNMAAAALGNIPVLENQYTH